MVYHDLHFRRVCSVLLRGSSRSGAVPFQVVSTLVDDLDRKALIFIDHDIHNCKIETMYIDSMEDAAVKHGMEQAITLRA